MSANALIREVPTVRDDEPLAEGIRRLLGAGIPAIPVVDAEGKYVGVFGEREVISAVLPGYVGELSGAAFVPSDIDEAIEHRHECLREPVSKHVKTEHVEAGPNVSSAQLAETFLHHRVAVVPVVEEGAVLGAILRSDFVKALSGKLNAAG